MTAAPEQHPVPQCVRCGYDLTGLEPQVVLPCPECGRPVAVGDGDLLKGRTVTRRLLWMTAPGLACGLFFAFVYWTYTRPSSGHPGEDAEWLYIPACTVACLALLWLVASLIIAGWQSRRAPPRSLSQNRAMIAFVLVLPCNLASLLVPVFVLRFFF